MYNILLVEDDLENCEILSAYLKKTGEYTTVIAHTAAEALSLVRRQSFDLILLDIMLPGMDGISLCVQLRRSMFCPIIFISCLKDEETIVRAMRMGGDDYITKPFRYPVLQAHIESALRRMQYGSARMSDDIEIGDMVLSTKEHVLKKNGEDIYLSPTEFDLLVYFSNNPNTILRFEEIFQHIWKKPSYGDLRTMFSHVRNLRKKLEKDPSDPVILKTVARIGYIFNAQ